MKNIFSDDLLRSENWTSHPTQWLKPWVSLKWSVFKTFHGKKSSKFENFINIRLVVTMILIKVWRKLLEFHTKFENMSHLNFSIAYFSATVYNNNFVNNTTLQELVSGTIIAFYHRVLYAKHESGILFCPAGFLEM